MSTDSMVAKKAISRISGCRRRSAEDVAAVHRLYAHQVIPADAAEAADRRQGTACCVNELLVKLVRRIPEEPHDQRRESRQG